MNEATLKQSIIFDVIDYIFDKSKDKGVIKEKIRQFSTIHRVMMRPTLKIKTNEALKNFIDNGSGYNNSIPDLYNSL